MKLLDAQNLGSTSDAVDAINYVTMLRTRAVNPVNVRIINASWGGPCADSLQLKAAIEAAGAADILFVTAAGNGDVFGRGQNIDELPFYPASYPLGNILSVAATDYNDQLARFSNFGVQTVDVAAPGVAILSTENGDYSQLNGTSMAAPEVSGVAALVLSLSPNATAAEVRDAILKSADPLTSLQGKVLSGGRLNAYQAVLIDTMAPQATITSAPSVTSTGGTTYQFSVTIADNRGLNPSSIGNGDFVVRRQGSTGSDISASLFSIGTLQDGKTITATFQITPPGGFWDGVDIGAYEIELEAGSERHERADAQLLTQKSGRHVYSEFFCPRHLSPRCSDRWRGRQPRRWPGTYPGRADDTACSGSRSQPARPGHLPQWRHGHLECRHVHPFSRRRGRRCHGDWRPRHHGQSHDRERWLGARHDQC